MSWAASGIVAFALFLGLSFLSTGGMLTWGLLAGFIFVIGGVNWGSPGWWRRHLWWGVLLVAAAFFYAVTK